MFTMRTRLLHSPRQLFIEPHNALRNAPHNAPRNAPRDTQDDIHYWIPFSWVSGFFAGWYVKMIKSDKDRVSVESN